MQTCTARANAWVLGQCHRRDGHPGAHCALERANGRLYTITWDDDDHAPAYTWDNGEPLPAVMHA